MTSHTPGKLNWNVAGILNDTITGRGVATVCPRAKASQDGDPEMRANAERLAHCWNCHDELVAELKSALATIEGEYPKHQHAEYRVPEMRDLIAKAEGK